MSDVFISYSKDDDAVAETLERRLHSLAFKIWWDRRLYAGEDFQGTILAALNAAKAVIVIWSDASVRSRWVLDEANRAMNVDKLIPTHVPQFDLANLPLGFGRQHTISVDDLPAISGAFLRLGVKRRLIRRSRY